METKQLRLTVIRNLVFILVIALFSRQAVSAESKSKSKTDKAQAAKQPAKKAVTPKTINPAVNPSSFRPDMPLREALDILRNTTIPPLNIVVLWKDLDRNADITPDTQIGMDGVSGVSLKMQLNLLLMSLTSGSLTKLGFVVIDNVILIGTVDSLPKTVETRYYYIADIAAPPSMGGMMPGMGMGMGMMPYGNMSPYGIVGNLGQMMQPGSTGYTTQTYPNQGYQNQTNQSQRQSYNTNQGGGPIGF